MSVGDLVKKGDIIALVVGVMHTNRWCDARQWIRVLGARDYVSEIGWKVINPAKTKVEQ